MSEVKTAYGLGQYVKHEQIKVGKNGTPAIKVYYTRLDGDQKGKEQSVQYLVGKLDEASKAILKAASETKGQFKVVKEKKETDEYYNFARFEDASTFVEKPKSMWAGNKGNGGGKSGGGYDSLGNQIGNSVTNAVNSLGAGKSIEEYKSRAWEFIQMGDELRAQKENTGTPPTPQQEVELSNTQTQQDLDDNVDLDF